MKMLSVLLRTSGAVTWSLDTCYAEYISLLRHQLLGIARLHVLTDVSMWLPDGISSVELRTLADKHETTLRVKLNGVDVFAYTVADIYTAFPGVQWPIPGGLHPLPQFHNDVQLWFHSLKTTLRTQGRRETRILQDGQNVSNLLSYFIHEPSLCLWARLRCGTNGRCADQYVWVIEDDAAFVGSIQAPLQHYRNSSSDLISVFALQPYIDDQWWLYVNFKFRAAFPTVPLHKWEHVERYSSLMLHRIDQLLTRGIVAYGELFASTVCNRSSWCVYEDLRAAEFVAPDTSLYRDSHAITRKLLASLIRTQIRRHTSGRWVHSVKDGCQLLSIAQCFARGDRSNVGHNRALDHDHMGSQTCLLPHTRTLKD